MIEYLQKKNANHKRKKSKTEKKVAGFWFLAGICLFLTAAFGMKLKAGAVSTPASDFKIQGERLVQYTGSDSTVWIPDTVRIIGQDAFKDHKNLYRVSLPGNLKKIERGAFAGCETLRSVRLPDTVTELGFGAYRDCVSLTQISFGRGMDKLGYGVFSGCTALSAINTEKNENFICEYGALYSRNKGKLYAFLPGSPYSKYTMPESVEQMAPYAFYTCENLKYVVFNDSLMEIPAYAFADCAALTQVTLPASVKSIGVRAFAGCENLKEAVVPESVEYIQKTAFERSPQEKQIQKRLKETAQKEETGIE